MSIRQHHSENTPAPPSAPCEGWDFDDETSPGPIDDNRSMKCRHKPDWVDYVGIGTSPTIIASQTSAAMSCHRALTAT